MCLMLRGLLSFNPWRAVPVFRTLVAMDSHG